MQILEKQSQALNSLRQISDYPSYLDQRIHRLDRLYKSLEVTTKLPKQVPQKQFYQTARYARTFRQTQLTTRELAKTSLQIWQKSTIVQPRTISQFKSEERKPFPKQCKLTLQTPVSNSQSSSKEHGLYQQMKRKLMCSLVVDGMPFVPASCQTERQTPFRGTPEYSFAILSPYESLGKDGEVKNRVKLHRGKRGRIWHGRPPVKIIQTK